MTNRDPYNNEAWEKIPVSQQESLKLYIEEGRPVGHFLMAILTNDLYGAVSRADKRNQTLIANYVIWLVNWTPANCWGSRENVSAWMEAKRGERERNPEADSGM